MSDTSPSTGPSRRTVGIRTGGRSERVVAAIQNAALEELARVGYAALRLEDVAAKAGVAKTTVYRRWPTKADLVQDAVVRGKWYEPLPETGSVRGDVLAMLERAMKVIGTPEGKAIAKLITTMEGADPEVERLCRRLKSEARSQRAKVIERAIENGDLPKTADAMLIMDTIFTLVMSRLVRFNERTTRAQCEQLIDLVITGAENGGGRSKSSK